MQNPLNSKIDSYYTNSAKKTETNNNAKTNQTNQMMNDIAKTIAQIALM